LRARSATFTLRIRFRAPAEAPALFIARKRFVIGDDLIVFKPNGFNFVFQILFNALKSIDIAIAHQAESLPRGTGAARTADAMHVVFSVVRQLEVRHQIDTQNIQTARGHIRRHQDIAVVVGFELRHHAVALTLREQARNSDGGNAVVV
jgi:hypothetical protein